MTSIPENLVLLVVEDREEDVQLIKRGLKKAAVVNPVFVVRDGAEAREYFQGVGKFCNRAEFPLPGLVMLHLKLPKSDGFELLQWIRQRPQWASLRIVALTSSTNIYDVNRAYELGADSFLVKPLEVENHQVMMRTLGSFWLGDNATPEITQTSNGHADLGLSSVMI
jgi:CheY-like chemotaxis protein